MTDLKASEVWKKCLQILEEQLQLGFLEQARFVVDVKLNGSDLELIVTSDDAFDFFSADVNVQRLIIVSRQSFSLETISVTKVDAEPIG